MQAEWEALNKNIADAPKEQIVDKEVIADKEVVLHPSQPETVQESLAPEPVSTEPKSYSEESAEKANWRKIREQNRELERKVAEMEARLQKPIAKEEPQPDAEEYELADDAIAEGKHYKALKREVKSLNEALNREKQERDKLAVEARLRANYPDIFKVVTKENMEALAEVEPEFVDSIISSQNVYSQHVAAYKLIKQRGIGSQDPHLEDKERAQRNLAKPKSASIVSPRQGESPLSEVDRFSKGMTPELQSQLLKEMEDAISSR
jgi:hypothetical protein